ncbi:MAG TPA: hypothetical protein VGH33_25305 [Isosphaeraceae bacterium]|jgi:hypothetical protein
MPFPTPEETRDEDVPAVQIELADGNLWSFALPGPRLHPVTHRESDPLGRARVRIELVTRVGYSPEVWRLWDSVVVASKKDASHSRDAFLRFAVALLRMAHEIEPEEAESLLDPRRVDLVRIARLLIPAAFGDAREIRSDGR